MKKHAFVPWVACAAAVVSVAPAPTLASDLIERTFLDFTLNLPTDYNFEMNRQLNARPRLNNDFYGSYAPAGWLPGCAAFTNLTLFAGANASWFESQETTDFDGRVYEPYFGASVQSFWGIELGGLYSPGFFDFDSFDDQVDGDGDAHRFGVFVAKRSPCGFKLGASYLYQRGELNVTDFGISVPQLPPIVTPGELDWTGHAVSLSAGFARHYGQNQFGKNIGLDITANFQYATKNVDEEIGTTAANFDYQTWWLSWRNVVTHNVNERVAFYGSFTLHHLLDERNRGGIPLLTGTSLPGRDRTFGEAGGGVNVWLGKGAALNVGARTTVLNDSYDNLTVGGDFSFKF